MFDIFSFLFFQTIFGAFDLCGRLSDPIRSLRLRVRLGGRDYLYVVYSFSILKTLLD